MLSSHVFSSSVDERHATVEDFGDLSSTNDYTSTSPSRSRQAEFQELRKKLNLRDELADYELCLECVLPNKGEENGCYYQVYEEGSVEELLRAKPIWEECMPESVHPVGGLLPPTRIQRKVQQVNNLVIPARMQIESLLKVWSSDEKGRRLRVVEFCAGSGFVLLPLAKMFPRVEFVLIDYKKRSIEIGRSRVEAANLEGNVRVLHQDISDYDEDFEVGLGLHACGPLTDITLSKCYANRAMFVVAPCCVGKVCVATSLPRSEKMRIKVRQQNVPWDSLLKAADFGHSSESFYYADEENAQEYRDGEAQSQRQRQRQRHPPWKRNRLRRMCKSVVEEDRRTLALEMGYRAHLLMMEPAGASPKNDVLLGWPEEYEERVGGAPIAVRQAQRGGESLESYLLRATFGADAYSSPPSVTV
jgi:hypothetical protein